MITFIIPTIGKDTLKNSIESLKNQTDDNWKAIIIFDGLKPNIEIDNPKITVLDIEKKGVGGNGAGIVRNYGMEKVDSEWIAFLDDDDTIAPDYVETFNKEIQEHPYVDVIIFRMYRYNWEPNVIPFPESDNFHANEVGISFALKTKIFKSGLKFEPSSGEDFMYLTNIRANNYCMMISPYVKYFVHGKTDPEKINIVGTRGIINKKTEGFSLLKESHLKADEYIPILFFLFVIIYLIFGNVKKIKDVLFVVLFLIVLQKLVY
uniref:Glycosyltransferase 2-like domain-containing protein n=1 Tax=viral metagenome TaxID=1070528 RepID=A0A6C0B8T6_9ZZZZ